MKRLTIVCSMILLLLPTSCSLDPVKEALRKLDNLEKIINNKTGDLTTELEKWRKDLPKEVRTLIDDDIQKLSNNIIGSLGTETKCTVDFLRNRFSQSVGNIKRKLLGEPLIYQKPCFCSVSLPQINPNNDLKSIEVLNFYGYDFESPDSSNTLMQAVLIGDGKVSKLIDEKFIGRTNNYQMVINIADILPDIVSNKYNKIKIYWNGDSKKTSEIVLLKWLPVNKIEPFQPRNFAWYPPHTAGDDDFDTDPGNWANGQVQVQFQISGNELQARLFYDVMEFGGDNTRVGINVSGEASAWGPWNSLYTNADPNYELIGYSPSAPERYHFTVVDQGPKDYYQAGSAVLKFTAFVDQSGPDVGNCHVDVLFNPMNVVLKRKVPH